MSFLIPCPNCGLRSAYEFVFGGEYHPRPSLSAASEEWARYLYFRTNSAGEQTEWWNHRLGCRLWFLATRNTSTNQVRTTFWPEDLAAQATAPESAAPGPGQR